MSAYLIVFQKMHDEEWIQEYVTAVPAIIRKYGGDYLAVSKRIEQIEGPFEPSDLSAIFTFPSIEAIRDFIDSEEYRPYAGLRRRHSDSRIVAIDTEVPG